MNCPVCQIHCEYRTCETLIGWVGKPEHDPNTVVRYGICPNGHEFSVEKKAGEWFREENHGVTSSCSGEIRWYATILDRKDRMTP